jgi:hypothetical protein
MREASLKDAATSIRRLKEKGNDTARASSPEKLEDLSRWLIGYLGPLQRDDLALPAVEYIAGQLSTDIHDEGQKHG